MTDNEERAGTVGDAVALIAARRLLRVTTRTEAAAALHDALRDLGGRIVEVRDAGPAALPDDVSLGVGEAVVVVPVNGDDSARELLVEQLPLLLEDARAAAARCDHDLRQEARARTDALTGLADRGETDTRLAAASSGDVVCLLDLDGFKSLNDTHGHPAGDRALRTFGALLRASVRDVDFVGRYGGDEFLVVFAGTPLSIAEQRMQGLVRVWAEKGPGVGVSVGVALVDERGPTRAAAAADRALYRAKWAGGARVDVALEADWPPR
ncbi:hypothetical protein ASC77_19335 [Nocardioides sp. Root1257]|uniref:GGDEF domain-containing protein n=1 Tax=unclassified Nocardioides TaxID=2615069 RepID=UPI000701BF9B|nr:MULTISPECIES: GGDEF domain-containing protein [unclassified Nocardioides]KQW46051.1 hypothetical protein ASC77_19335 [Nocardioides sp. Root1257]KRC43314.1 hypothetical protein ASE24_20300 [Nocardioides sp. Root224]